MSSSTLQSVGQFTILPSVPGVFKKNCAELRGVGGMGGYGVASLYEIASHVKNCRFGDDYYYYYYYVDCLVIVTVRFRSFTGRRA